MYAQLKTYRLPVLTLLLSTFLAMPSHAAAPSQQMQLCTQDSDCVIAETRCSGQCGITPLNRQYEALFRANEPPACDTAADAEAICSVVPPLASSCIKGFCTVSPAYERTGERMGKTGEVSPRYGIAAQAAPQQMGGMGEYISPAYDKSGEFTAYDLPVQIQRPLAEIDVPPQDLGDNDIPLRELQTIEPAGGDENRVQSGELAEPSPYSYQWGSDFTREREQRSREGFVVPRREEERPDGRSYP